jgi:hypothetical protein
MTHACTLGFPTSGYDSCSDMVFLRVLLDILLSAPTLGGAILQILDTEFSESMLKTLGIPGHSVCFLIFLSLSLHLL